MHPTYEKKRTRALVVGTVLCVFGVLGIGLPLFQGVLLLLFGVAVLSPYVPFVRAVRTRLALMFPHVLANAARYESRVLAWVRLLPYVRTYTTVKNSDDVSLSVIVDRADAQAGTAIVLHSASGTKETHISSTLADRCYELGYSVVRFDAANGAGESGGSFSEFTTRGYLRDLEDIVAWARTQEWCKEPLVLVGHSAGGTVSLLYAAQHPDAVQALLLLAPMTSGVRYEEAFKRRDPEGWDRWRTQGSRVVRHPLTKQELHMPFTFVEDARTIDVYPTISACAMPVTILHGDNDRTILREDMDLLRDTLGTAATLVPLPAIRHIPQSPAEFAALRTALASWSPVPGA